MVTSGDNEGPAPKNALLCLINNVILVTLALGLIAGGLQALRWSAGLSVVLYALASLAVGAVVGLLFGVPRVRQREDSKDASGESPAIQPQINNNLIEVSDWLTKIIVGVGLVELKDLPVFLKRAATPLSTGIGGAEGLGVAVGTIVFFAAAGFLAGYINSRTVIAGTFHLFDRDLLKHFETLEKKLVEAESKQVITDVQAEAAHILAAKKSTDTLPKEINENPGEDWRASLLRMANSYEAIRIPDYGARVAAKDRAASEIVRFLLGNSVSKQDLGDFVSTHTSDGTILALAAFITAIPAEGDFPYLLKVGRRADWLHVKFRVALAIRALFSRGFGTRDQWLDAMDLLQAYRQAAEKKGDRPLMTLSDSISSSIRGAFGGTPL